MIVSDPVVEPSAIERGDMVRRSPTARRISSSPPGRRARRPLRLSAPARTRTPCRTSRSPVTTSSAEAGWSSRSPGSPRCGRTAVAGSCWGAWVGADADRGAGRLGSWVTSLRPPTGGSAGHRRGRADHPTAHERPRSAARVPGDVVPAPASRRRRGATVRDAGHGGPRRRSVTVSADRGAGGLLGVDRRDATLGGAMPLHPPYVDAANGPGTVGYWRLGIRSSTVLPDDDFETFNGWSQERNGSVQAASSPTRSGTARCARPPTTDPNWRVRPR